MNKPVVHYAPSKYDVIVSGMSAYVLPVDHPGAYVSNETAVRTSTVVVVHEDGSFETKNTLYKPLKAQHNKVHATQLVASTVPVGDCMKEVCWPTQQKSN